jgi:hypothetical protein
LPTAAQDAHSVVGPYESSRRNETNFLAVLNVLGQSEVTANADNTISVTGTNGLNQQPLHFQEIAPLLFRQVDGKSKLAFVNVGGRLTAYSDFPMMVAQQVTDTLDKQSVNYRILGFSLFVIITTLVSWPIAAMVRKHYAKPLEPSAKRLRTFVYLVCLSVVVCLVGWQAFFSAIKDFSMLSRSDPWVVLLQVLGLLVGVGSLVVIYYCIRSWAENTKLLQARAQQLQPKSSWATI